MSKRRRTSQSGIALLMAVFALLLLSAIALSMIYAANIETGVSANFRDKEIASYAAASGMQIARDLVRPNAYLDPDLPAAQGGILLPNGILQGLPSTSAKNVLYIINPATGETVAPWNPSNAYADPELCHDYVLGLSGTTGVPCSGSGALPTGSWYHAVNASDTPFADYMPANFKWVRVQMKTDKAAPVPVGGTAANGSTQVCWDGTNQFRVPGAPDATCGTSTGTGVSGVIVTAPGYGYSGAANDPIVTIAAPPAGGVRATAHAITKQSGGNSVAAITMLTNGTGYTSIPTVTISGGGGTGATATAVVGGSSVQSIDLANAGTGCFTTPPTVTIASTSGTGATATATLSNTTDCIVSFLSSGTCKKSSVTVGLTGGGGTGATGTTSWDSTTYAFKSATVTNNGTGYTSQPTAFSGISTGDKCTGVTPTGVVLGKRVTGFQVTANGSGYLSNPTVTFAGGGTGTPYLAAGANVGKVTRINVTNGGTGYTSAPTVTISGGGGSGATAQASINLTYVVDSIVVDNPGSGYTVAPTVSLFSMSGTGAKAKTTIGGGAVPGRVFLITALGYVSSRPGAQPTRTLVQMEAANPPQSFNFNYFTGALTIDGPTPSLQNIPNSENFKILGNDANTCGETQLDPHPAVGVYDNQAVTSVTTQLSTNGAKSGNYTGVIGHPNPDVENVFNSLGEMGTTVSGMEGLADSICSYAATLGTLYGDNALSGEKPISSFLPASTNINSITCINGNLTIPGSSHGYGVLLVRGDVVLSGDYSWSGPIFVIGSGSYNANGGGNGQIQGALIVAKTRDSTGALLSSLGSPIVNFEGGGGNGIQYDHCWADNLLAKVPLHAARKSRPLQVLSVRTIQY